MKDNLIYTRNRDAADHSATRPLVHDHGYTPGHWHLAKNSLDIPTCRSDHPISA